MDFGLGSFLGGAANAISSIFTARQNLKAQREANAANMELAKYQNEANVNLWREQNAESIKQWERNNAYNTPEAQMARYRDAGLNPMLIYGSGSAISGNSSSPASIGSAPHLERAEMKPVKMDNIPFGDYYADAAMLYLRDKQVEKGLSLTDADIKDREASARQKDSQTRLNILNADITEAQKADLIRAAGLGNDLKEQNISESKSRVELNASNIEVNAARAKELESRLDVNAAQAKNLMKNIELSAEKIAGMKLSRRFDELTFNDRYLAVIESVSQAMTKTDKGYIELDMAKLEKTLYDAYGILPKDFGPLVKEAFVTTSIARYGVGSSAREYYGD